MSNIKTEISSVLGWFWCCESWVMQKSHHGSLHLSFICLWIYLCSRYSRNVECEEECFMQCVLKLWEKQNLSFSFRIAQELFNNYCTHKRGKWGCINDWKEKLGVPTKRISGRSQAMYCNLCGCASNCSVVQDQDTVLCLLLRRGMLDRLTQQSCIQKTTWFPQRGCNLVTYTSSPLSSWNNILVECWKTVLWIPNPPEGHPQRTEWWTSFHTDEVLVVVELLLY